MSFLDSSSLSDHSTTSSSFVHLTSLDRTKLAKFESFSAAFSSSKASKLARHDGALSTVDTVPYLHKAYHRQPAPADDGSRLPGYLKSLLLLQTPGGKWQHSPSVLSALSSNVSLLPSPPPGIAPDLWATALALASIRRCPEHIDELKEGYGKGLEWVSKELIVEVSGPEIESLRSFRFVSLFFSSSLPLLLFLFTSLKLFFVAFLSF